MKKNKLPAKSKGATLIEMLILAGILAAGASMIFSMYVVWHFVAKFW